MLRCPSSAALAAELMRVLVLTTEPHWSMSTRLLLTAAEGLALRGDAVTACYPQASATATGAESHFPNVALHTINNGSFFAQWRAVRRVVVATRPSAVLVHGERDTLIAAFAIGRRGGVVRRERLGETVRPSWRTRLAAARTKVMILFSEQRDAGLPGDVPLSMHAWPTPAEHAPRGKHVVGTVRSLTESHERLVLFPSRASKVTTAVALRTAAHLLTRYTSLRVTLVGDETVLQGTRIHAASLGLADRLDLLSVDEFLYGETLDATAVWITTDGDEGAIAAIFAMTRAVPVVVPSGSNIEPLIAPRITGFVADARDPSAIVAALARLFSDPDEQRAMRDAAAARASRVHGWSAWLDRVAELLQRASGQRTAHPPTHVATTSA